MHGRHIELGRGHKVHATALDEQELDVLDALRRAGRESKRPPHSLVTHKYRRRILRPRLELPVKDIGRSPDYVTTVVLGHDRVPPRRQDEELRDHAVGGGGFFQGFL